MNRSAFPLALSLSLSLLAGCGSDSTPQQNALVPTTGLVSVNSDFATTTVSLIDPVTRALVRDDCVDSGSVSSDQSLTLSGDVVLPSQPQAGHPVVLIDRKHAVLSWVDPQTCKITGQLRVGSSTFAANPHDVVPVADGKIYVTRYARNADAAAQADERGDDLLIVDPRPSPPAVMGRIDLASFAGEGVEAHPDAGILAGGKVYVSLGNQSADYTVTAAGRVVAIDPGTDQVTGMIDLPGLKGCSRLDYIEASKTLVVACGGSFSDADQTAGSGIALVDLGAEPTLVKKVISGTTPGAPFNFLWVRAFAENRLFAATLGATDFTSGAQLAPDALYLVDGVAGTAVKILEAAAYDLGRAAGGGTPGALFLPDAKASGPAVHIIDASASPPVEVGQLDANPANHLAPREIAWY